MAEEKRGNPNLEILNNVAGENGTNQGRGEDGTSVNWCCFTLFFLFWGWVERIGQILEWSNLGSGMKSIDIIENYILFHSENIAP